jgi:MFS family permease
MRDLTALILTGIILNFALVSYGVRTYAYFQVDQLFSQGVAILALAPMLVGSIVGLLLIVRAVRKVQARKVIAGGLLVMAAAIALTAVIPTGASYWLYVIPLFIFGLGYLVAVTVWISAFLRTAVDGYYGLNAGINKAAAMLGAAVGATITGNLLTVLGVSNYTDYLLQRNLPTAESSIALADFRSLLTTNPAYAWQMITELGNELLSDYLQAYAAAYSSVLLLTAALCTVSAIIIALGLRRSLRAEASRQREGDEVEAAT